LDGIDQNFKRNVDRLLSQYGIEPKNYQLYYQALSHPSAARNQHESYEILEFLGDSLVLVHVVSNLVHKFPKEHVGNLSKAKSRIVSGEKLSKVGYSLKLDKLVRIDRSAYNQKNRLSPSIMADIFEAFVAAIFLDHGMLKTRRFLKHTLCDLISVDIKERCDEDFKSILQEKIQRRYKQIPIYKLIKTVGPDHDKRFYIQVFFRNTGMGKGDGRNKKEAEQKAADKTLKKIDYFFKKIDKSH
jgi:ribonuclease III